MTMKSGRLDLTIPEAMPKGGEIYALVRQGGRLQGMIRIYIEPNDGPLLMRDLATVNDQQIPEGEIVLAEIDRSGTNVDAGPASLFFYPFEKTVAARPEPRAIFARRMRSALSLM